MRRLVPARLALFAFLLSGCVGAAAQGAVPAWTSGTIDLNSGWRVQNGDNLAWAQPGFDGSSWPGIDLSPSNGATGWKWYRLHTAIPASKVPLALLITGGSGTYEVYVNGQRIPGPALLPDRFITWPRAQMVSLPAIGGNVAIALRTRIPALTFLTDGVVEAQNVAGELFGFDRAGEVSMESAESIALAASAHGQSDDITVLTLQYAPAEVLHA